MFNTVTTEENTEKGKTMTTRNQAITAADAKTLVKHMSRDFDIVAPRLSFLKSDSETLGDYGFNQIRIFGSITIGTLVHEFVHHLQFCREGKTNHSVNFHRACFEVRDYLLSVYGIDCRDINGYTHTASYDKALTEWFNAKMAKIA